jgi:hypothetical protein
MSDFKLAKGIDAAFAAEILPGAGTPHRTSQPLVRMHEGKAVLCSFASTYTSDEIRAGRIGRPRYWAIADLATGALIARFDCREYDFSAESFDTKYSMQYDAGDRRGAKYFDQAFAILDEVRRESIGSGMVDKELYRSYFTMVVDSIPPEYRIFYRDLGSPDSL